MPTRTPPTAQVADARRYAAHARIVLALAGLGLLAWDPGLHPRPVVAVAGLLVIAITGLIERSGRRERWLGAEEACSCLAGVSLVTLGDGTVTALTLLWLVAAAVGVLARGGRVGATGRVLLVATLASALVVHGVTADDAGLVIAAIALLLATGRISRQTAELLRDPLTGVLSRAAFCAHVDRLAPHAGCDRPAALIMVDLDDFGTVNKRRGHAAGDALLMAAAQAMGVTLRGADVIGRVGGDEFAILVFGEGPIAIAERVIAAVIEESGVGGASAGVARCPRDGDDAVTLLGAADVALRVAKREGKGCVAQYEGASLSAVGQEGARAALDRLCAGEGIEVAVQAIVDLDASVPHAYEALARFATRGREGPLHWFAVADGMGRRAELERACLRAALVLAGSLPGDARLNVNLSPLMLCDADALELLADCPALQRVVIEVPGERLLRCEPGAEHAMAWLRGRGVRFAVDDIGIGYTGLGQLAVARPAYLKLDRTLVRDLDADPSRIAFVRSLAEYAREGGCRLVAEGIESQAELDEVRAAGIDLAQGFLLGRPGAPWPPAEPVAARPVAAV